MIYLVLSDLHLGNGLFLESGERNTLEDFDEDERFSELLDYYGDKEKFSNDITLIFNGDIFNLIEYENIPWDFEVTEKVVLEQLEKIYQGHPVFFKALKKFLNNDQHDCHFVFGNHDLPLVFEGAQNFLRHKLSTKIKFSHAFEENGIYVEHGQRFESHNHIEKGEEIKKNSKGESVINLPWGSLFVMNLMPSFKKQRPYFDKVRPTELYIRWCFFNDFTFFWYLTKKVFSYFFRTRLKSYLSLNKNYKTTLSLLLNIKNGPALTEAAEGIFKELPHLSTVVLGHTHIAQWRKISTKKLYFNSGTWNTANAVDLGKYQTSRKLYYVEIIINSDDSLPESALLKSWVGLWRPYRDEAGLGRSKTLI